MGADTHNCDLELDKVFLHRDTNQLAKFNQLSQAKLSRDIYFRPSHCPLITLSDYYQGSCFEDWVIPTVGRLESTVELDDYQHQLYQRVRQSIVEIYSQHNTVILALSGGIDSVCILSFLIELDLVRRTRIMIFRNRTQTHSDCLHTSDVKETNLQALVKQLNAIDVTELDFGMKEMAVAMDHSLAAAKCYSTHAILNHYHDQAILFGLYGNYLMLHSDICLDEILSQNPTVADQIKSRQSQQNFYTSSLANYVIKSNPVPMHRRHLMLKPWNALDGHNNNVMYYPLASDWAFDQFRRLNFANIDPDTVFDAQVARSFITQNQQSWLMNYVTTEGTRDLDNLEECRIPINMLDSTTLDIPMNLVHDTSGLEWIQNEVALARTTGVIPINSLISIKSLQHIANEVNKF
jgi:hypothetical protein